MYDQTREPREDRRLAEQLEAADCGWLAGAARTPDPEQAAIRRQEYGRLSAEAQELIRLVLDTPADLLEALGRKKTCNRRPSDSDMVRWLRGRHPWSHKRCRAALDEVKGFVGKLFFATL